MTSTSLRFFLVLLASCANVIGAFGAAAASAAVTLKDHSAAVAGLFNNMRTPAALIGGALVPIGMLTAPTINKEDSRFDRVAKRANILLAVSSLLSEVLAVVYASIAINKLTEVPSPLTGNVAELIAQKYELAWLGTNIHFLYGLMGFGLIVGGKAYFLFGNPVGKIAGLWSVAAFFQSLSIVNAGIAQGTGDVADGMSSRFASNFLTLCIRYISLVFKNAKGGACSIAACGILLYSLFLAVKDMKNGLTASKTD